MKLLFDANISPSLKNRLSHLFPDSKHVFELGLEKDDEQIWSFSFKNGFTIVSKDSDFFTKVLFAVTHQN